MHVCFDVVAEREGYANKGRRDRSTTTPPKMNDVSSTCVQIGARPGEREPTATRAYANDSSPPQPTMSVYEP